MKPVVIISGGSDGLGKEIAKELVKDNTVIILARTEEKLKETAAELHCEYYVCDVANNESVIKTVHAVKEKYSRVDCLINNAALFIQGGLDENDAQQIQQVININITGTILLTKAVVPIMKSQKDGVILNIISQAGFYGKAERSIYTATKFALTGFTKSILPELAKYGIRVTGVYPGKLNTQMFAKMGINKEMNDALHPSEVAKTVKFILSLDKTTQFPEIGIKHIKNL
jgi:short-subunit dehydrogenase